MPYACVPIVREAGAGELSGAPGSLSYYGLAEERYLGQGMPQRSHHTTDQHRGFTGGLGWKGPKATSEKGQARQR